MKSELVLTVVALSVLTSCGKSNSGGGTPATGGTGGLGSASGGAIGRGESSGGNNGKGGNGTGGASGGTLGTGGNGSGGAGGTSTGGSAGKGGSTGSTGGAGGSGGRWLDRWRWGLRRHVKWVGRQYVIGRVDRNRAGAGVSLHAQLQREDLRRRRLRRSTCGGCPPSQLCGPSQTCVASSSTTSIVVDAKSQVTPISSGIYGVAFNQRRLDAGRSAQPLGRRRHQLVQLED